MCGGGNLASVTLDLPLPPQHTVSGVVKVNSATPVLTYCGGYSGTVYFDHLTDSRFSTSTYLPCDGTTPWQWTVKLYPGTYKIRVNGNSYWSGTFPDWEVVAVERLLVP